MVSLLGLIISGCSPSTQDAADAADGIAKGDVVVDGDGVDSGFSGFRGFDSDGCVHSGDVPAPTACDHGMKILSRRTTEPRRSLPAFGEDIAVHLWKRRGLGMSKLLHLRRVLAALGASDLFRVRDSRRMLSARDGRRPMRGGGVQPPSRWRPLLQGDGAGLRVPSSNAGRRGMLPVACCVQLPDLHGWRSRHGRCSGNALR